MTIGSAPESDRSEQQPLELDGLSAEQLRDWLSEMVLIRVFEEACEPLALDGSIPGGIHMAVGQEAVAVGAIAALDPHDVVASGHRPHHHALAKGITPRAAMAELFGRATGCLGGRGGSMHLGDPAVGHLGGNGIVGASVGIAMGAALASKLRGGHHIAVGFFGDGGANTGRTWESVNLATVWSLPLVVVCENNQYAVETPITSTMRGESIAARAAGFGLPAVRIDGQDVGAVYHTMARARRRALAGEGPTFIEAVTYRYHGHNTGEVVTYRTQEEVDSWRRTRDPIDRLREAMARAGQLSDDEDAALVARAHEIVADAVAFAQSSPWPDAAGAASGVTGLRPDVGDHA